MAVADKNAAFWSEPCGTTAAIELGAAGQSPGELARFDRWFFAYYPYLLEHVRLKELAGRDVLEIGLGYGSLSQRIAESGARYAGLDIAPGTVEMANTRLRRLGLPPGAVVGSALEPPFPALSFDHIVTIGSLHHTGDTAGAIRACHRLLRPGGSLTLMVYYAYSYRLWKREPARTARQLIRELAGYRGPRIAAKGESAYYDLDSTGVGAPHVDFVSVRSLRAMCSGFQTFRWRLRNLYEGERPFLGRNRNSLLQSRLADTCGLDLYATAQK